VNTGFTGNIKMALASIRAARWRSFLTMLGVVIGVLAVVTIVSIGQGVKQQVSGQIDQLGRDLISIRPGGLGDNNQRGLLSSGSAGSVGLLSDNDMRTIKHTKGVQRAVPLSLVNGEVSVKHASKPARVIATTADLPDVIHQPIAHGQFFSSDVSKHPNVAVIGSQTAQRLFHDSIPLGRTFRFLGQTFVVQGVFKRFDASPFSPGTNFNNAIFIPQSSAQALTAHNLQTYEALAKPQTPLLTGIVVKRIDHNLALAHRHQQQYSVTRQSHSLNATNNILGILTRLIGGVAAISLLVGGIGIMDVMLVSVTERTHEIGIRKALGATNRQILTQFITESGVLSLVGGVIGVLLSILADLALRIFTDLQPVITAPVVILAVVVSLLVGIVFGSAPALKAARKDPITALRNE
jgi:putative ABC transport system permease protein